MVYSTPLQSYDSSAAESLPTPPPSELSTEPRRTVRFNLNTTTVHLTHSSSEYDRTSDDCPPDFLSLGSRAVFADRPWFSCDFDLKWKDGRPSV
ncbi:hypothetical protein H4R34_004970 [Dimargaris verticillata]|uniref:Uncharacterized protein n=1 Tax=Dimargaris verticillata TaxID=2761393 RepID=A0A9W8AZN3_9FUNG|nr:hypothetical protein H4R34_004970 [Dimargaris verticillata]